MIANPLFPRESKCNALIKIVLPERVQQRLHLAFDDAVDPDLVESCIFEIRSLQSRVNYLLRQLKAEEESVQNIAAAGKEGRRKWI